MTNNRPFVYSIILAGLAPPVLQSLMLIVDPGPVSISFVLMEWVIYIVIMAGLILLTPKFKLNVVLLPATFVLIGHVTQAELLVKLRGSVLISPIFKAALIAVMLLVVQNIPNVSPKRWWLSWPLSLVTILISHLFYTTNLRGIVEHATPWFEPISQSTTSSPAVIVVVIDTLRADAAVQMDSWKFLEERCSTWDNALSASSWTIPTMASIWTGKYPAEHGAIADPLDGRKHLPIIDSFPMLAEELSEKGYATGAVIGNPVINQDMGFHRGIDNWNSPAEVIPMPVQLSFFGKTYANIPSDDSLLTDAYIIYERSLAWQKKQKASGYFLWTHFFDPHLPYFHPEAPENRVHIKSHARIGWARPTEEYKEKWFGLYMDEVAYADHYFMKFLEHLEDQNYFENNIFVFTVDHGEEFWDDGGFGHSHQHSPSVVDIPIAYCSPNTKIEKRTDMASILDINSTIKAELGMPFDGVDLREPIPERRTAFAMTNKCFEPQITAKQGNNRVIRTFDSYEYNEYNDKVVSGEATPLINLQLDEWTKLQPRVDDRSPAEADVNRLRSIGYVD